MVPRLVLLNGPPGNGKSTLGRMFAADHPLALCLDIDQVRAMLGRWRDDAAEAGRRARAIALAAARAHLLAGYDVIIPQLVARPEFLEQLAALAAEVGAGFHEIVLMADRAEAWRRLTARGPGLEEAVPLTEELLAEYYDRLTARLRTHPATVVAADGDAEATYRRVLAGLS